MRNLAWSRTLTLAQTRIPRSRRRCRLAQTMKSKFPSKARLFLSLNRSQVAPQSMVLKTNLGRESTREANWWDLPKLKGCSTHSKNEKNQWRRSQLILKTDKFSQSQNQARQFKPMFRHFKPKLTKTSQMKTYLPSCKLISSTIQAITSWMTIQLWHTRSREITRRQKVWLRL